MLDPYFFGHMLQKFGVHPHEIGFYRIKQKKISIFTLRLRAFKE